MNQTVIAERLISLRKKAGLSQSAVADLLAVTRQAVSKWESGKASPSLEAYAALAALYKTTIEAIITGKDYEGECDLDTIEGSFFAERLKNLRIKRALSQGEVSEALSVSRQSVSKWERGESEPDAERLIALSQLFRTPLSLLLPYTKKKLVVIPDEEPIVEETVVEEPVVEEPVVEEPVVEEPIVEEPVVEESVVEESVVEESVVEEPVVEEPITEEPVVEEPVTEEPIVEEDAPTITRRQDEPTKKRYRDMLRRAALLRKKKKEEPTEEETDGTPPFRTISDVGPNDPAYVYVGKDDKKLRTVLPLLAAIPLAAAALALIFKKK